jgi:predicted transcriptional regulator
MEDIMYELYFRQRIDRGLEDLDQGQVISHKEVRGNLAVWLKSSGR